MKPLLQSHLNGRKVLLLFLLTTTIYTLMLTLTIPKVMAYAGGMKLPDMMPGGYSAEYMNTLLNALGERGRHAYLFMQIPLDMLYPGLFGITYCLILAYFLTKLGKENTPLFYVSVLPLFAGLFDYCENVGFIAIFNIFPEPITGLVKVVSVFSVLKSSLTTLSLSILGILLILWGGRKLIMKE